MPVKKSRTQQQTRWARSLHPTEQGRDQRKSFAFYDARLHNHRDTATTIRRIEISRQATLGVAIIVMPVHMVHSSNTSLARAISTWKSKDTRGRGA